MEENQRVTSYQEASVEFRQQLIKLYNEKIFPRQGKVFADMLFQTGIEAGAFLCSLGDIDEIHVKKDIAQESLIRLKRTEYLLYTMKEAGYYAPYQVVEMEEFLAKLLKAVKDVIVTVYAQINAENNKHAYIPQPPKPAAAVPVTAPVPVQPAAAVAVVPAPKPQESIEIIDPDGFNAPAGK